MRSFLFSLNSRCKDVLWFLLRYNIVNRACRNLVILLQILALVISPQLASVARADAPELKPMMIGASPDHHNGTARRDALDHDRGEVEDSMCRTSTVPTGSPGDVPITCDPCCTVGIGHCVTLMFALPGIPEPQGLHATKITRDDSLNSRQVAPLGHPPKVHA